MVLINNVHTIYLVLIVATDDQVDNCKAMINKLSFPYEPANFENPALQQFYMNLEAMALSRDQPEGITDYTSES